MRDSPYHRAVDSPPDALVRDGRFCFGTFNEPFRIVNPEDASRPLGAAMPGFVNNFRLKEWEAFQLGNDDYFLVGAVYNAKALGLVQLAIVHKHTGRKWLHEKQVPGWSLRVASGLYSSRSEYTSPELTPQVKNEVMINILGVLGSDYYGPYGDFEGRIRRADGSDIDFTGFYGMGEQKTVRI